jgi:phenylalanyl-tRNA synthetase alpha chain
VKEQIQALFSELEEHKRSLSNAEEMERFRNTFLSRKGRISVLFDQLKSLPPNEKPECGKLLNNLRKTAEDMLARAQDELGANAGKSELLIDPTLTGRCFMPGHQHVVSKTIDEIKSIFTRFGFSIATGPEIETDFYNFEALNFPPDHPARDMQDTFFLTDTHLLRTHGTPVQVRLMMQGQPPIRAIMPGKVFRNEVVTARSHMQFHQIDGVYVDKHVTFADLKSTLVGFARQFYGSSLKYRFRPSYFPFTEPSAEMDITCYLCGGSGCRVCKQTGWLEILGCGMVDPNVFKAVGYDPDAVSGYAFGIGIERTVMLRLGIDDIRLLFDNDLRVNQQFS